MKKIKKKIYSLISSLLVPGSFVSTTSNFKAFDEDEYVIQENEEDQDDEDEETSEEENEYDDYGLKVGTGNEILNYVKSHPWKTAGWVSLLLMTKNTVSGLYDTLRSPSSKSWDDITTELITKHLANKQENKSKEFDKINDKDKIITIINILKDISDKMASMCEFLGPCGTVKPSIKNTITALKDITYYKIMGNYKETEETLVRKGIERNNWVCYYVAVTLKKCCDKLGLKSTIAMNYTGHTFLLVKSPVTFTYHNDTLAKDYNFEANKVIEFDSITGNYFRSGTSYEVWDKQGNYRWYNTNIIYGKHNKCYRIVSDPINDDTSVATQVFANQAKQKNDFFTTIIDSDEEVIAQNPNIKELPIGTKPLNYMLPASYIDMLRQP